MMRFPLLEFPLHPRIRLEYSHELPLETGWVVCCMESKRNIVGPISWIPEICLLPKAFQNNWVYDCKVIEKHLQLLYKSSNAPSCGFRRYRALQDYFLSPEVRRGAQSAEEALQLFKSIEEMRMVTVVEMISWTYVGVIFPNPTDTKVQSSKIGWHELSQQNGH